MTASSTTVFRVGAHPGRALEPLDLDVIGNDENYKQDFA